MKKQVSAKDNAQSGSVLILIFIAIALFAALSYVLSQSSSGSASLGTEKARLGATEILEQANAVKSAVKTLTIGGCKETQISFNSAFNADGSDVTSNAYYNAAAPTNHTCHVFHPSGGGLKNITANGQFMDRTYSSRPDYAQWIYNSHLAVENSGTAFDKTELVIILPYITKEICTEINKLANIQLSDPNASPQQDDTTQAYFVRKYAGSYDVAGYQTIDGYGNGGVLKGQAMGCTSPSDESANNFFQVLIAR